MRNIRLHIVLAKGHWKHCITSAYLKTLLDNKTITELKIQSPDADSLCDFILGYVRDDDDDYLADGVYRALIHRFQPEYESMVDVSVEDDCIVPFVATVI